MLSKVNIESDVNLSKVMSHHTDNDSEDIIDLPNKVISVDSPKNIEDTNSDKQDTPTINKT